MLENLAAAVAELREVDPRDLGHGEAVLELQRLVSSLDAINARATAAFDASDEWALDGAHNAKAWMKTKARVADATIGRRLRLGRGLRELPATEAAWLEGDIDSTQVSAMVGAHSTRTTEAMARDEAMLVGEATKLRHDHFIKVLGYWCQMADPDGAEDDASAKCQRRRLHLSQSFNDMWFGDFVLDPISGAIVYEQLSRIEAELFEADWAEAKEERGEEVQVTDLARSPRQRRADALAEMARRAGTAPADGRRPEPLFSVLVDYPTAQGRVCELANGTVITPGSLVPWLDQAWLERVVFESRSRVIDLGRAQRLFSGATRRAVKLRDRECFHGFCDVPGHRCQVDHIEPWSTGGATTERNGRMACGFHNRRRGRGP